MASSIFLFPWIGDTTFTGNITAPTITATTKFLAADGSAAAPSYSFANDTNSGLYLVADGFVSLVGNGARGLLIGTGYAQVPQMVFETAGSASSSLLLDAANTLAQKNGTNSQISRLYGYSSGSRLTRGSTHAITEAVTLSGATSATSGTFIPVGCFVIGVATSTTTTITGASGYQVGDGTTAARWGDITGTAVGTNSNNTNSTANPSGYFAAAQAVTLTAKTSNFTGGVVQVTVFYLTTGSA